jgi:hypothetical protein
MRREKNAWFRLRRSERREEKDREMTWLCERRREKKREEDEALFVLIQVF